MRHYELGEKSASENPTPLVGKPDSQTPAD
jgi:hypothetical protein